ncbi:RTA1-domain-containing protein [Aspergillus welwitschiae]|uniref:RTA1-domain-containing protein n=1 Tax=Aspergillus welwitschiae TaxID=1341132 RepID=A0A3F3QGX1_9EURO|nr:RTA1-domain-containing protein [Aspergillus welwitschiae]RDH38300.1 RTA1-domain-containing protein [Aspergillus welwitschiae]
MTVHVEYLGMYDFVPSEAAAIVFAILFLITTILHYYQAFRWRVWFFIPFLIGCACKLLVHGPHPLSLSKLTTNLSLIVEVIGYIARAKSSTQYPDYNIGPELIQYILILVAPALLAASIYMEFGRLMIMVEGEQYSIIRRAWLTKIFVLGDVISFFAQFIGAAMLAKTTTASKGQTIMKLGVLVQIVFFGLFLVTIIIFHKRLTKYKSRAYGLVPWRKHLLALYATGLLIFVRSIFRFAEFVESSDGPLTRYEWVSYVFDAVMMLATCASKGAREGRSGWMAFILGPSLLEMLGSLFPYNIPHIQKGPPGPSSAIPEHSNDKISPVPSALPLSPLSASNRVSAATNGPQIDTRLLEATLLHHYYTNTHSTLVEDENSRLDWQVNLTKVASTQSFALDSLLAFTALHLAYLEPNRRQAWTLVAFNYSDKACSMLSQVIGRLSAATADAAIVCSIYIVLFAIAQYRLCRPSTSYLDEVLRIAKLIRGCVLLSPKSNLFSRFSEKGTDHERAPLHNSSQDVVNQKQRRASKIYRYGRHPPLAALLPRDLCDSATGTRPDRTRDLPALPADIALPQGYVVFLSINSSAIHLVQYSSERQAFIARLPKGNHTDGWTYWYTNSCQVATSTTGTISVLLNMRRATCQDKQELSVLNGFPSSTERQSHASICVAN